SLHTALALHSSLTRYIVCFPFDLTGRTARKGRSSIDKFEAWRQREVKAAARKRRRLTIEPWPASILLSTLLEHDPSGGIRELFFNATVLSPEWFQNHLVEAMRTAGPRYTPELSVETNLWRWLCALGRRPEWADE